jgi:hypothetical protein
MDEPRKPEYQRLLDYTLHTMAYELASGKLERLALGEPVSDVFASEMLRTDYIDVVQALEKSAKRLSETSGNLQKDLLEIHLSSLLGRAKQEIERRVAAEATRQTPHVTALEEEVNRLRDQLTTCTQTPKQPRTLRSAVASLAPLYAAALVIIIAITILLFATGKVTGTEVTIEYNVGEIIGGLLAGAGDRRPRRRQDPLGRVRHDPGCGR